jgi:hypothetical protein
LAPKLALKTKRLSPGFLPGKPSELETIHQSAFTSSKINIKLEKRRKEEKTGHYNYIFYTSLEYKFTINKTVNTFVESQLNAPRVGLERQKQSIISENILSNICKINREYIFLLWYATRLKLQFKANSMT